MINTTYELPKFSLTYPCKPRFFQTINKVPWLSLTFSEITIYSLIFPDCTNPALQVLPWYKICNLRNGQISIFIHCFWLVNSDWCWKYTDTDICGKATVRNVRLKIWCSKVSSKLQEALSLLGRRGGKGHIITSSTTAQKMKFFIKSFFSKCDKIRRKLRIWSHLLKKSLMENFIFCAVYSINIRKIHTKYSNDSNEVFLSLSIHREFYLLRMLVKIGIDMR